MSAAIPSSMESQSDYSNYIIDPSRKVIGIRSGGRGNQSKILTYDDGTEWVYLNTRGPARFCGYLFLKNALERAHAKNCEAAENKMALHNRKVIYLSKYCGDKKPDMFDRIEEIDEITATGFQDIAGMANLREIDDKIFVFDTEKSSFDPSVHEQIDSFLPLHDAILATLETSGS